MEFDGVFVIKAVNWMHIDTHCSLVIERKGI